MNKPFVVLVGATLTAALVATLFRVEILYFYDAEFLQSGAFKIVGKFHPTQVSDDGFEVDLAIECERGANQQIYIHLDPPLPYVGISDGGMVGIIRVNDVPRVAKGDIDLAGNGVQFGDPYIFQKELYQLPGAVLANCSTYEAKLTASNLNFNPKNHTITMLIGTSSY